MNVNVRPFEDKSPVIGQRVYIDPFAVIIGEVMIGDDVSLWPMSVVRGDVNRIHIGNGCSIQDGAVLHVSHDGPYTQAGGSPLILGQGITVAHHATLHGCQINDYCLIGMGALVMDNVVIGDHVMVGAGSLVPPNKQLESGHLYLGNPVRKIREISPTEYEQLEYSAHHYIRLKNRYLGLK